MWRCFSSSSSVLPSQDSKSSIITESSHNITYPKWTSVAVNWIENDSELGAKLYSESGLLYDSAGSAGRQWTAIKYFLRRTLQKTICNGWYDRQSFCDVSGPAPKYILVSVYLFLPSRLVLPGVSFLRCPHFFYCSHNSFVLGIPPSMCVESMGLGFRVKKKKILAHQSFSHMIDWLLLSGL